MNSPWPAILARLNQNRWPAMAGHGFPDFGLLPWLGQNHGQPWLAMGAAVFLVSMAQAVLVLGFLLSSALGMDRVFNICDPVPSRWQCVGDLCVTQLQVRIHFINHPNVCLGNLMIGCQRRPTSERIMMMLNILEFLSGEVNEEFRLEGRFRCFTELDTYLAACFRRRPGRADKLTLPPDWDKQGLCEILKDLECTKKGCVPVLYRYLNCVKEIDVSRFEGKTLRLVHNYSERHVHIECPDLPQVLPILVGPCFAVETGKAYGYVPMQWLRIDDSEKTAASGHACSFLKNTDNPFFVCLFFFQYFWVWAIFPFRP